MSEKICSACRKRVVLTGGVYMHDYGAAGCMESKHWDVIDAPPSTPTLTPERLEELAKYAEIRSRPTSKQDCFITPEELAALCAVARRAARALETVETGMMDPFKRLKTIQQILRGDRP